MQWLKCNGTQGNAVPPPPIYGSKRSPTSDCYIVTEWHTTIVIQVLKPECSVPPRLILHFNHCVDDVSFLLFKRACVDRRTF